MDVSVSDSAPKLATRFEKFDREALINLLTTAESSLDYADFINKFVDAGLSVSAKDDARLVVFASDNLRVDMLVDKKRVHIISIATPDSYERLAKIGSAALTGAAIGSIFPGVGTIIGAVLGGIAGNAIDAVIKDHLAKGPSKD